jgi:hypothetical protein
MAAQPEAVHWTYVTGNRPAGCESPPLQPFASGGQLESSAAYVLWPPSSWVTGSAEERAAYFNELQRRVERDCDGDRMPSGRQASTLFDLMTIRAFHSKSLRLYSLGTALGFRTRQGALTNIPAIIVFVARKVHGQWLLDMQKLPNILEVCMYTHTHLFLHLVELACVPCTYPWPHWRVLSLPPSMLFFCLFQC